MDDSTATLLAPREAASATKTTPKYTPRRWEAGHSFGSGYKAIIGDRYSTVCLFPHRHDDDETLAADAALIAAAPCLLAALKELLGCDLSAPIRYIQQARDAVTRATMTPDW